MDKALCAGLDVFRAEDHGPDMSLRVFPDGAIAIGV